MSDFKASPLLDDQQDHELPAAAKPFYGWWIALASTIILFVSSGIGFYGQGVILDPLTTNHGWSKATVSSAIRTRTSSETIPPQARVSDRLFVALKSRSALP